MMVRRLKLELNRRTASEDFIISDIQIVLPPGAKLTPLHLRTLTTTEPCVFTLTLTSDDSFTDLDLGLSWTNWRKSVEIFISQNFLQALFLNDSVTPSPTVSTTIACSPACYDSLLETHPALHAASELVGGFVAVWNLALNVNLQRLRMLADSKQKYVLDVFWTIFGKNGIIVDYEGTGKEAEEGVVGSEREISFVDRVGSTRTVEEKIRDCQCFECGGGTFQDPISVVRRCGVDTVRAALALGGFDLDAFDARPPTQPVDQDSFETFLRSFT
ncbi:hypothetical protein BDY24DRAFT_394591 [Mrakia frigida]|uniref:uncharacterized protein n=1 Tax=Mrakia frigida TaxID=29902 RepID=UPI003FCC0C8B